MEEELVHDKRVFDEIKKYIKDKLQSEFGFCGVAEGEDVVMLNSGRAKNIIINMKIDWGE